MKFINAYKLKDLLKDSDENVLISADSFEVILDKYGEEWFYDRAEGWTKAEEEE